MSFIEISKEEQLVEFFSKRNKKSDSTILKLRTNCPILAKAKNEISCFFDFCLNLDEIKINQVYPTTAEETQAGLEILSEILALQSCILRKIDLAGHRIEAKGFQILCQGLKKNSTVEMLDLTYCHPDEESFKYLADFLVSDSCNLNHLNLYGNDLDSTTLATLFCDGLQRNSTLQILCLSQNPIGPAECVFLADYLKSDSCILRSLILHQNQIEAEGVRIICDGLIKGTSSSSFLKELDLRNCKLNNSCCEFLADYLKSDSCSLKILELFGNQISDEGILKLFQGLEKSQSILELNLGWNHLSNDCVPSLCKFLMDEGSTLSKLNLTGNSFSIQERNQIEAAFMKSKSLIEFDSRIGIPNAERELIKVKERNKKAMNSRRSNFLKILEILERF